LYGEEICLCGIIGIFCKPHESQVDGERNKGITKNMFSPTLFVGRIQHKYANKNENGIFCHIFPFLRGNLPKKIVLNFFHHIPLGLGGWGWELVSTRFLLFGTSSRNMLPFNAKSFLGCSHMIQHEKFEKKKKFPHVCSLLWV
jgi:hypothetical protein